MGEITPDLVEWMIADDTVAAKWKNIAVYLDLSSYIPNIESRRNRKYSLHTPRSDRQKLAELLTLWKIMKADTFTVPHLLRLLDKQGLKDMYEWVRLMTGQTLSKVEIENLVLRQMNSTPRPCSVRSEVTGLRRTRPVSQYFSLPTSPRYTPQHSRPVSQISFWDESTLTGRASVSPRRDWTNQERAEENKQISKHTGVFNTLYQPQHTRRFSNNYSSRSADSSPKLLNFESWKPSIDSWRPNNESWKPTETKSRYLSTKEEHPQSGSTSPKFNARRRLLQNSKIEENSFNKRHSSYITSIYSEIPPLKITESVTAALSKPDPEVRTSLYIETRNRFPLDEKSSQSLRIQRRYSNNLDELRLSGGGKTGGRLTSEKYFDNLISLIEEASSSLEI